MARQQMNTKLAWITGGGSGIGRALALALLEEGWEVVISGRTRQTLLEVHQHDPRVRYIVLDVTDRAAHHAVFNTIVDNWGCPQLVVLNAGTYRPMPAADFDLDLVYEINRVNYLGVMNGLSVVLPDMRRHRSGQILLMASVAGYRGLPGAAPYGASKAALINFAESLYMPLRRDGIRLRVVNPGFVTTPLTQQNDFYMPAEISPERAARAIVDRLDGQGFEISFPLRFTVWLKLLRCLPYRLYFALTSRIADK